MASVDSAAGGNHYGQEAISQRTIAFINIAHALDHFVLLIFPTAVIAIAANTGLGYAELIALSTGAFVAFGALSLPAGFAARKWGRRNLMAVFYFGVAFACGGMATAQTPLAFTIWLLLLGSFAAIYHPVGSPMLVANAPRLGRALGVNGVWGNMGAALASGITAWLAMAFGWQAAFLVPAVFAAAVGTAFLAQIPNDLVTQNRQQNSAHAELPKSYRMVLAACFILFVLCGGMTFNMLTIALPKIIDERLGLALPLGLTGSIATLVFVFAALTQISIGRILDRVPLPVLFAAVSCVQPIGFAIASTATGIPLLAGLLFAMASIYGNVVVMDAIVARYVPDHYRSQAYGLRYFLTFSAAGFAVPLIAYLHGHGGFTTVLAAAAALAVVLAIAATTAWWLMTRREA